MNDIIQEIQNKLCELECIIEQKDRKIEHAKTHARLLQIQIKDYKKKLNECELLLKKYPPAQGEFS